MVSDDPRIARIERGIKRERDGWRNGSDADFHALVARIRSALADLHACRDMQAADAALDRLDALWGIDE